MKTVHLQYVAMIREAIGRDREAIPTAASTVAALYDDLVQRYRLPWPKTTIRPAVNDRISAWETPIADNDRILFLPPSSGG